MNHDSDNTTPDTIGPQVPVTDETSTTLPPEFRCIYHYVHDLDKECCHYFPTSPYLHCPAIPPAPTTTTVPATTTTTTIAVATDTPPAPTTTVLEDSPSWDCATMGNQICGPTIPAAPVTQAATVALVGDPALPKTGTTDAMPIMGVGLALLTIGVSVVRCVRR